MGTFYTIGIIKYFEAKTTLIYPKVTISEQHFEILNRNLLDISLYNTKIENEYLVGELKKEIFKENIEDLYKKLKQITGAPNIDYYFELYGKDIERYPDWPITIEIDSKELPLLVSARYILLFIEGKVFAEEFNIEPRLINWLFRYGPINNKLTGCMISDVMGISSSLLPRYSVLRISET